MPTSNPRLTITLTPAVAAVLRDMSDLSGNSQSAIVGELLEMSLPVFERVAAGIRAARTMQATAKGEIVAGLQRAQEKLEQQLDLAMETMDDGLRPLLEHAERVQRRAAKRPEGGPLAGGRPAAKRPSTPHPLTGGSGGPNRAKTGGRKGGRRGRV
jgi:hypothetical protein